MIFLFYVLFLIGLNPIYQTSLLEWDLGWAVPARPAPLMPLTGIMLKLLGTRGMLCCVVIARQVFLLGPSTSRGTTDCLRVGVMPAQVRTLAI
jgi:hypothetical protein